MFVVGAAVVVKWLEQGSCNLEVSSPNLLGARAFFLFFYQLQSVLNQVPSREVQLWWFSNTSFSCVALSEAGSNIHRMKIFYIWIK